MTIHCQRGMRMNRMMICRFDKQTRRAYAVLCWYTRQLAIIEACHQRALERKGERDARARIRGKIVAYEDKEQAA